MSKKTCFTICMKEGPSEKETGGGSRCEFSIEEANGTSYIRGRQPREDPGSEGTGAAKSLKRVCAWDNGKQEVKRSQISELGWGPFNLVFGQLHIEQDKGWASGPAGVGHKSRGRPN